VRRRPSAVSSAAWVVLAAWVGALGSAGPSAAADGDVQIDAQVAPDTVRPGGIVYLTVTITGGAGFGRLAGDPEFELVNLERASAGPSRSEQFQFVNGSASRSIVLRYALRAGTAGEGKVSKLRAQSGDRTIEGPERAVTIDAAAPEAPIGQAQPNDPFARFFQDPFGADDPFGRRQAQRPLRNPKVFARAELEPSEVYVGQQALYTLYLYTQADIAGVDPEALPDFRGFWARELPRPADQRPRPEQVEVDGERFTRVALLQKAIFPLEARSFEVPPVLLHLAVRVPQVGLGGLIQQVANVDRQADAVRLVAKPLPPPPANASGAVGSMRLEATLEPARLEVGQAATLSLSLSGEGNFQGVRDPVLPPLDKVRIFPPQQESYDEVRGKVVRGRRTWKWVLVPSEAGTWSLPPIEMAYFDPKAERYEIAATETLSLLATAAAASVAPAPAVPEDGADANEVATEGARRWRQSMRWLPWGLTLIFGVIALLLWRRHGAAAGSAAAAAAAASAASAGVLAGGALGADDQPWAASPPEPTASPRNGNGHPAIPAGGKLPSPSAKELLGALEQAATESRPRAFATAVEDVVREWLDRRWNLPPATPVARWSETLIARGAPAHGELLRLLGEELRYLRFAPELGTHETVRQTALATAKQLIQS
jgi:hypothetical protein